MRDEVVVRPNDRLIRGVILCIAVGWWLAQGRGFVHDGAALMIFASIWFLLLAPLLWLFAWVALGRWVIRKFDGELIIDRRLGALTFWQTAYPVPSISGFRVEEQRRKIKGNTSPRYRVLMSVKDDTREIAWSRQRTEAETLARELHILTRESN
jgi:hypothetical protein